MWEMLAGGSLATHSQMVGCQGAPSVTHLHVLPVCVGVLAPVMVRPDRPPGRQCSAAHVLYAYEEIKAIPEPFVFESAARYHRFLLWLQLPVMATLRSSWWPV